MLMEIVLRTFPGRLANLAQTARQVSATATCAGKLAAQTGFQTGLFACETATARIAVVHRNLARVMDGTSALHLAKYVLGMGQPLMLN